MPRRKNRIRPAIGTRVMRGYGRENYIDYGEIGTVTAHNDNGTFQMTLDEKQPFYRSMWGRKAKITDYGGTVHKVLNAGEVVPLVEAYETNARRLRAVAKDFTLAAKEQAEIQRTLKASEPLRSA